MEQQNLKEQCLKALNEIRENYDAYFITNKYDSENNTHKEQFDLIKKLPLNETATQAFDWIYNCYDCYYKDELDDSSAFAYLENYINNLEV